MIYKEAFLGMAVGIGLFLLFIGHNIIPILLLGGLIYAVVQRDSLRLIARPTANMQLIAGTAKITFDDIGGQQYAKRELKEALKFIKSHRQANQLGIRPLNGILLSGPPGTGKTLLAKAAANYTEAVFFAVVGSEFVEMYAGVGAQRIRTLFKHARDIAKQQSKKTAVVFIDEIDVLGSKRGQNSSHLEYDQTLNQLLAEMDGIHHDNDIQLLVIAATNRQDMLDSALLRPGRFDRIVQVDLPDQTDRIQILKLYAEAKPLQADIDFQEIAQATFGFSGAHLENLLNEAAILALREGQTRISQRHLMESVDKVSLGAEMDRQPDKAQLRRIAIHESGHAIVAETIKAGSVSSLTIISRGRSLGHTRHTPVTDHYIYTEKFLANQIQILLAGLAAEELVFGTGSTGAEHDLTQAAAIGRQMIKSGMSNLGLVDMESLSENVLSTELNNILSSAKNETLQILLENQCSLWKISKELLQHEKLSGDQLRDYLRTKENLRVAMPQPMDAS